MIKKISKQNSANGAVRRKTEKPVYNFDNLRKGMLKGLEGMKLKKSELELRKSILNDRFSKLSEIPENEYELSTFYESLTGFHAAFRHGEGDTKRISFNNDFKFSCTCRDFLYRGYKLEIPCKHILMFLGKHLQVKKDFIIGLGTEAPLMIMKSMRKIIDSRIAYIRKNHDEIISIQ